MRTRVFGLLLLMAGGIMFAQTSATKGLSITVSAPPSPTGNLLTGMTPARYTLPSGWSVLCTQNFEGFSVGADGAACMPGGLAGAATYSSGTVQNNPSPYTGKAWRNASYNNLSGGEYWLVHAPTSSKEVYVSWYQRLDPMPSGICYWGGDWYFANFKPNGGGGPQLTINPVGYTPNPTGNTSGAFGYQNTPIVWQPQGVGTDSATRWFTGGYTAGCDGQYRQWEVHYSASTAGTGNNDGVLELWIDGSRINSFSGVNLNGTADMHGMEVWISGQSELIMWLTNVTGGQLQCDIINANSGPYVCGKVPGDGYGCDMSGTGRSFSYINSKCSSMAPPQTFYKYIDDVIVLYK